MSWFEKNYDGLVMLRNNLEDLHMKNSVFEPVKDQINQKIDVFYEMKTYFKKTEYAWREGMRIADNFWDTKSFNITSDKMTWVVKNPKEKHYQRHLHDFKEIKADIKYEWQINKFWKLVIIIQEEK